MIQSIHDVHANTSSWSIIPMIFTKNIPTYVIQIAICVSHPRFSKTYDTEFKITLQCRHNERDGVSQHQPHDCLLNRLFRRRPYFYKI